MAKNKFGVGNRISLFRGRDIDVSRPVQIYRNLHGKAEKKYSIRQGGLVCGHTNQLILRDVTFVVSPLGRARVLDSGRKNVHAYARGHIHPSGEYGFGAAEDLPWPITYDPRKFGTFVCCNLGGSNSFRVLGAGFVHFNQHGVSAAYIRS